MTMMMMMMMVCRWLWPGNGTFLEVDSMVFSWWIVAFFLPSEFYTGFKLLEGYSIHNCYSYRQCGTRDYEGG